MREIVLDLETDGLLDKVTKVHCMVLRILRDGHPSSVLRYVGEPAVRQGLDYLTCRASQPLGQVLLIAHNGLAYDRLVLRKLYGWEDPPGLEWYDTMVSAAVAYPTELRKRLDWEEHPDFGPKLRGSHSLAAWGRRLGEHKGEYTGGWETYSQEMLDYCIQDTAATAALYRHLAPLVPPRAYEIEAPFSILCRQVEARGVTMREEAIEAATRVILGDMADMQEEMRDLFPGPIKRWETPVKKLPREKQLPFNPNSRIQLAAGFVNEYGWKPKKFGKDGHPTLDETVLKGLLARGCEKAEPVLRWLMLGKRLGQISTGKAAWAKLRGKDGRVHGRVAHNGAQTHRCSHSRPNVTQCPKMKKPYGALFRGLWEAPQGYRMVGVDASGLELRGLAHYLAIWDGGAYRDLVLQGDPHQATMDAIGAPDRDAAKTYFYARLYGCGDYKAGRILGAATRQDAIARGRSSWSQLRHKITGFGHLVDLVQSRDREKGYVLGPDGRRIYTRGSHSALNSLLQGFGAILMKHALVFADRKLQGLGLIRGVNDNLEVLEEGTYDYSPIIFAHDEVQYEVKPEAAEAVRVATVEAVREAGEYLGTRCPFDAEGAVGGSWAETH